MGDFLIKMHNNKMDPKIRKKQADQLAVQGLILLLVLLSLFWGFPLLGQKRNRDRTVLELPLDPTPLTVFLSPSHTLLSEDTVHGESQGLLILMCHLVLFGMARDWTHLLK